MSQNNEGREQSSPVREGDIKHVSIRDVGRQGDGMARVDGLVVFVKGVKVGEELDVRIVRVTKNAAFAEPVQTDQRQ